MLQCFSTALCLPYFPTCMANMKLKMTNETIVPRTMPTHTFPWPCRFAAGKNVFFARCKLSDKSFWKDESQRKHLLSCVCDAIQWYSNTKFESDDDKTAVQTNFNILSNIKEKHPIIFNDTFSHSVKMSPPLKDTVL